MTFQAPLLLLLLVAVPLVAVLYALMQRRRRKYAVTFTNVDLLAAVAGRSYSRRAARRTFTLAQLREAMTGIEYRDTEAFLDEIPAAYKPIDQVMADSADLVSVRHTLRQIVNVKGD